jgi:hypothetical protein
MSQKIIDRINEEIKKLQDSRTELDKTIGHYQHQIDSLIKQYAFLEVLEGALKGILASETKPPCIRAVDEIDAGKSSVPPLSEIKKANANIFSAMTLAEALVELLKVHNSARISFLAVGLKAHGYKSKSKNLRGLVSQCLGAPKHKKLFKRIAKGTYALRAK